jgi:plastocyanin
VLWIWDGSGHNVKPDGIPPRSDWSGTPGGRVETFGSGYRYSHTFETPGQYDYLCVPHQSSGMRASFTVE